MEIGRSECDRTGYVCFEGSGTLCDFEKRRTRCCRYDKRDKKKWTYPTTKGDAYFPIVDKNGNIYFTEKGSQTVHAVNANGAKIWEKKVGNNLNYSGGALSTDGILYIGTQSNNKVLGLDITNGNIVFEEIVGQQVMAAVTIGPDKRLYCGTIGSGNIGSIKAFCCQ